jgi:hypothetical protein
MLSYSLLLTDLYYQLKEIEKNKETEDYNERLEEN